MGCHGPAILLTDQRMVVRMQTAGGWRPDLGTLKQGLVGSRSWGVRVGRTGNDGVDRRYIFRTTLASFALVLVSLTGVIWITQALRGIDLMTSQGQTIITFLGITSLVILALVLVIAPIALMIAISHTLNKLATDSEIIVMNAAGFRRSGCSARSSRHLCSGVLVTLSRLSAPDGLR